MRSVKATRASIDSTESQHVKISDRTCRDLVDVNRRALHRHEQA
jgi:hypothetical protein